MKLREENEADKKKIVDKIVEEVSKMVPAKKG